MKSALYWIRFGVYVVVAISLLVFSVFFFRHVYVSLCLDKGEVAFLSLLLGIILFLVGGGILCTAVAHSMRRVFGRGHIQA